MPNSARPTESVWDYPRPPRIEGDTRHVVVESRGVVLADTRSAVRVLETSHPPVFYIDREDVVTEHLIPSSHTTFCEFKGHATYWDVRIEPRILHAAWSYPSPRAGFTSIADRIAFYPSRVDCSVDGEWVDPQAGDFYGGWVTSEIIGPFKGGPGTLGW